MLLPKVWWNVQHILGTAAVTSSVSDGPSTGSIAPPTSGQGCCMTFCLRACPAWFGTDSFLLRTAAGPNEADVVIGHSTYCVVG